MSSQEQELGSPPGPSEIEVPIHYMVDTGETPVFHQTASAADPVTMRGTREARPMTIRNARLQPDGFSLDVEGFTFAEHVTAVADFYDDAQLSSVYTPEIEQLIARIAGASEVVVFDHTRRSTDGAQRVKRDWRDPVPLPHSDYTDASAAQRMRDVFGDGADDRLTRRFAVVNVWRSMTGPIEQWPVAVCDARTINDDRMHKIVRSAPHRTEPSFEYSRSSETRHASYDANHRWFYFPQMTRNETLLFKNYDTLRDGTARYALHSAFEDPTSPSDPAPRESIESRAFLFFD
ncbi:MAG: methyltransferase [Alphaproteobacteria bacterium]|nr:methyltransferase [Alphaproteobacteria bacterium]